MNTYKCFLVDSGKYLFSVKGEKEDNNTSMIDAINVKLPPNIAEAHTDYVLNLDDMETLFVECMSCGASFSSKNPVFVKGNMCPTCTFVFQSQYEVRKN
jgi:hypothetical protein